MVTTDNRQFVQKELRGNRLGHNHWPFSSQSTREGSSFPGTWIVNPKTVGKNKEKDQLWGVKCKTFIGNDGSNSFWVLDFTLFTVHGMFIVHCSWYIWRYPKMLHKEGWDTSSHKPSKGIIWTILYTILEFIFNTANNVPYGWIYYSY